MKLKTFNQGLHPDTCKTITRSSPIKVARVPVKVILPLQQHLGCAATPLVKVGDEVVAGQKIAASDKLISASIHASISGKVTQITKLPNPCGYDVESIVIEGGQGIEPCLPARQGEFAPFEIRQAVKEAGIVGLGGAAFPTQVKLCPPKDRLIDTAIINGCECEPYITADYRLMLEQAAELILGAELIAKAVGATRLIFSVEDNKVDVLPLIRAEIRKKHFQGLPDGLETVALATKYPQGSEKMLIKALLNREVPSRGLPLDVGVVVHNVATAVAVYEAVVFNKPLIERVVTVTGPGVKEPQNLLVRLGTTFKEVIDQCGGLVGDVNKVVMGGPMTGVAVSSLDLPVVKATNCILVLTRQVAKVYEEKSCIRCGRCIKACPVYLMPNFMADSTKMKNWEKLEDYKVADCIECGCCSYVCPSRIPLVQYFKIAKQELSRFAGSRNNYIDIAEAGQTRRAVCR